MTPGVCSACTGVAVLNIPAGKMNYVTLEKVRTVRTRILQIQRPSGEQPDNGWLAQVYLDPLAMQPMSHPIFKECAASVTLAIHTRSCVS